MNRELVERNVVSAHLAQDKAPYFQRLARIEGQVRGLRKMIEENRTCTEELQQANAIIAAVREVALLLISQQLKIRVGTLVDSREDDMAMQEITDLLRATFRLQ